MTTFSAVLSRRNRILGILVLILLLGVVWYLIAGSPTPPETWRRGGQWDQPSAVRTVVAERGDMDAEIRSIGTVTPLNTVTVRSRVDGVLNDVLFQEGAEVSAGELLAQIDPLPYQAGLEEAEGQLQQNRAQLENARADLELYEGLWQQDSIARQQLSSQRALVEELEGTIRANEAQVRDARLQLSWTRMEAPISGKLGLRRVDPGNLVSAGDTDGLVTITQMRPISVMFTVPEVNVQALRQAMRSTVPLRVEALDRNEKSVLATGELTTVDNQIDIATGTLRVRARFDNSDDALFPNQFVNVRLRLSTLDSVIIIPGDAVQYGSDGAYVYVVEEGKAFVRRVNLGPSSGERVIVLEGLKEGEKVVLEGLDRLRDGGQVISPDGSNV